jgi:two-component system chemotaxis response regulator CheB
MSPGEDERPAAVIGVGASAGGVEALTGLMRALPSDLPAAVLVVLHVPSSGTSVLPMILDRAGPLPAVAAPAGERLRRGVVYVAPPNLHLVVRDGVIELLAGPRENGHRPAVDPLLTSIAAYGDSAIGVILSGTRDDGSRGMLAIREAGGTTLVQDPDEALFDGMIRSVQRYVKVDGVLGVAQLASTLSSLSRSLGPGEDNGRVEEPEMQHGSSPEDDRSATRYTCPDCGGVLWRHGSGDTVTFRCSVGHAYSPASFDGEQGRDIESALWAAARLLGDRHTLLEEMARNAAASGHDRSADAFTAQAEEVAAASATIRGLIESGRLPLGAVGDDVAAA